MLGSLVLLSLRRVLKSVPTVGSASDSSDTYTDMCVCVCMSVMEWDEMAWNVMLCYVTYVRMHVCLCVTLYTSIHVYIYIHVYVYLHIFT